MKRINTQNGFSIIAIIIILVVIGVVAFVGYKVFASQKNGDQIVGSASTAVSDPNQPPLKLKHIGIELGDFNATTSSVGDVVFFKDGLEAYNNKIFFPYGDLAEANSAAQARLNPQPTFIVPLGTKIHSLVDGVVVNIEKLYSNDYSVMVADKKDSQWIYELEHVINPTVQVGDKVKAGQVVAEASTHDSQYHPGYGLYEIGILHAGNPPEHVCIFNYLDDSIKQQIYDGLNTLMTSWETYMGDTSLYDEANMPVPGCITLAGVPG